MKLSWEIALPSSRVEEGDHPPNPIFWIQLVYIQQPKGLRDSATDILVLSETARGLVDIKSRC